MGQAPSRPAGTSSPNPAPAPTPTPTSNPNLSHYPNPDIDTRQNTNHSAFAESQVQVLPTSLKKVMLEEGVSFEAAEKILKRLEMQQQGIHQFLQRDTIRQNGPTDHTWTVVSDSSLSPKSLIPDSYPDPSQNSSHRQLFSPSVSPVSAKSQGSDLGGQAKSVASMDDEYSLEAGSSPLDENINFGPNPTPNIPPSPTPSHHSIHNSQSLSLDYGSINPGSWRIGQKIGNGSFGEVYHGWNKGQLIVIKALPLVSHEMDMVAIQTEINVMKFLKHPHIVQYLGAEIQVEEHKLLIFQEWVPGGSIRKNLDEFGPFEDTVIREYTRQVLSGLTYLHEHHIIHRDIKGANILVNERGIVKLADFGACKLLADDMNGHPASSSLRGTPYFMAPEVLLRQPYGRRADIWSLGGAVLEMATGKPPWSQVQEKVYALAEHISQTRGPPPLPETLHPQLRAFLLRCFERDRLVRPTAAMLAEDPYLHAYAYDVESKSPKRCVSTPNLIAMQRNQDFMGGSINKIRNRMRRINTQGRFSWIDGQGPHEVAVADPTSDKPVATNLPDSPISPCAEKAYLGVAVGELRPSSASSISSTDSSPGVETSLHANTLTQSTLRPNPLPRRQMRHLSIRTEKTEEEANSPVLGPLFQPPRTPESDAIQEFYERNNRIRKMNILQRHRNCDSAPVITTTDPSPPTNAICTPRITTPPHPRVAGITTPKPVAPMPIAEVSNWPEWAKRKHREIMTVDTNLQTHTQTQESKVCSNAPQIHLSPQMGNQLTPPYPDLVSTTSTYQKSRRSYPSLAPHIAWKQSQRRGPPPRFIRLYETLEEVQNESESPMGSPKVKPRSKRNSPRDVFPIPLVELTRSESDSPVSPLQVSSRSAARVRAVSTDDPTSKPNPSTITHLDPVANAGGTLIQTSVSLLRSFSDEFCSDPESPKALEKQPSQGSQGSQGYSRSSSVSSAASTPSATQVEFQSEFGTFRNSTTFRAVTPAVLLTAQASRRRTQSNVSDSAEADIPPQEQIRMTADEELLAELEAVMSLRKNEHMRLTRRRSIRWFVNLWNRKKELKQLDHDFDNTSDLITDSNPNPAPCPNSSSQRPFPQANPGINTQTAPNPFARSRIVQNSATRPQL